MSSNILPVSSDFVVGENSTPKSGSLIPTKPDYNVRWIERSTTYHLPNVTFSYEASYPNPSPGAEMKFGFNIQWQRLPYTLRFTQRYMLYCVVSSVHPDFSNVICEGDVVLRINDENMFYHYGDDIPDEDALSNKLNDMKSALTIIRFLRIASNCANAMLSPSEIQLFSQDKGTTAKFVLKPNKETPPRMVLESTNIESNTPLPIRRMMQTSSSSKPLWTSVPIFKEGPMDARIGLGRSIQASSSSSIQSAAFTTLLGQNVSGIMVPTYSVHEHQSSDEINLQASEVYRDRNRYIAVFADQSTSTTGNSDDSFAPIAPDSNTMSSSLQQKKNSVINNHRSKNKKRPISMLYNIGRYDTEDEARKNLQRAQTTADIYETFDPYYFIKEITKKSAPTLTIPTTAAQGPTILTINTSAAAAINRTVTATSNPTV